MLIEKVIGNIEDEKYKNYTAAQIKKVEIEWHERHKRILKKGDIAIRLSDEQALSGLKTGDVLAISDNNIYVIEILPTEALIINVPNESLVAKVCYEIGNKHAPLYRGKNELEFYTLAENPIKVLMNKLGVRANIGQVMLTDENMISGNVGHSHSHDGGYDGNDGKITGSFYEHSH